MTRRVDLKRWQPHVEEARRRGVTLKAYAAELGVSVNSLYRASQVLGQGGVPTSEPQKPAVKRFARVRVVAAATAVPLRVAAQLPNGVSLHVEAVGSDVAAVIAALAALPCSA